MGFKVGRRYLVTGGAGFIGSALVRQLIGAGQHDVTVVDKLTYAGNRDNLASVASHPKYRFVQADICDGPAMQALLEGFKPDVILHLAAETHVDRSIDGPGAFIQTNVVGTCTLLQAALGYWKALPPLSQPHFRFLHVSTDEVFGSLGADGLFCETSPCQPNSPYSASKAASDHLVRAWHHTYGLPVVVSSCCNNYGPFQFPEKLVPLVILNALEGRSIPVYGTGENIRDWLYVEDHALALALVAERGRVGQSYNVGASAEKSNLEMVQAICRIVDELAPGPSGPREQQIRFVQDRPGHDWRYGMDARKIRRELGWQPCETFDSGLRKTVEWYLDNRQWPERIGAGTGHATRLGIVT